MTSKWRSYEVLLPRRFNDGSAVPNAWLGGQRSCRALQWIKKFTAKWKKRLKQIKLWTVSYEIRVE
jgi:hypothetical protein